MNYDYIIYKRLHIHYRDGSKSVVDLEKKGTFLWYHAPTFLNKIDEDDELYETKRAEIIRKADQNTQEELRPSMQPIVVYSAITGSAITAHAVTAHAVTENTGKNAFVRPIFETKYKDMIEDALSALGKGWETVTKVVKVEERELC